MQPPVLYPDLQFDPALDGLPPVLRPSTGTAGDVAVCDYAAALDLMQRLVARPPDAPDVVIVVQHPPVATLGRRGGRESLLQTSWQGQPLGVHEVGRGGKVTLHGPGQLVVYPIVQLPLLQSEVGRGPLGDLPAFARLLEQAMQAACDACGVPTIVRSGFAGLWTDEVHKIGSLGVAVQGGWSWHGIALNVAPDLDFLRLMVPCGIDGAQMTSLAQQCAQLGKPAPEIAQVTEALLDYLRPRLRRRDN